MYRLPRWSNLKCRSINHLHRAYDRYLGHSGVAFWSVGWSRLRTTVARVLQRGVPCRTRQGAAAGRRRRGASSQSNNAATGKRGTTVLPACIRPIGLCRRASSTRRTSCCSSRAIRKSWWHRQRSKALVLVLGCSPSSSQCALMRWRWLATTRTWIWSRRPTVRKWLI